MGCQHKLTGINVTDVSDIELEIKEEVNFVKFFTRTFIGPIKVGILDLNEMI